MTVLFVSASFVMGAKRPGCVFPNRLSADPTNIYSAYGGSWELAVYRGPD